MRWRQTRRQRFGLAWCQRVNFRIDSKKVVCQTVLGRFFGDYFLYQSLSAVYLRWRYVDLHMWGVANPQWRLERIVKLFCILCGVWHKLLISLSASDPFTLPSQQILLGLWKITVKYRSLNCSLISIWGFVSHIKKFFLRITRLASKVCLSLFSVFICTESTRGSKLHFARKLTIVVHQVLV